MRVLLSIILSCIGFLSYGQEFDFRKTNWGMSSSEVINSEEQEWNQTNHSGIDIRYFNTNVGGLSALVGFLFIEDKLYSAKYSFSEDHSNKNLFISDFEKIQEILADKYGKFDDRRIWSDDLYRGSPNDYGMAVSIGDYSLYNIWETDKETIYQALTGDNYEIQHIIEYTSIEFSSLREDLKNQQNSSDF